LDRLSRSYDRRGRIEKEEGEEEGEEGGEEEEEGLLKSSSRSCRRELLRRPASRAPHHSRGVGKRRVDDSILLDSVTVMD
jgi:hypothetical protein